MKPTKTPSAPATETPAVAQAKVLAREYFLANNAANAAKREAEGARENLLKVMEDNKLDKLEVVTKIENKPVTLVALVSTPQVDSIDVRLLKTMVSEEQFLAIVSATKKAVTEQAGSAIVTRCTKVSDGTRNVSVKPLK